MRSIIIGDVHGCLVELKELLAKVALTKEDTLIFCGDLVDKGPDSAGVIKFVRNLTLTGYTVEFVKGNHEEMHIRWANKPVDKRHVMKRHELFTEMHKDFSDADRDYLETAKLYVKVPGRNMLVVHAGVPPRMRELPNLDELPSQSRKLRDRAQQLLRIRYVDDEGGFLSLNQTDEDKHTFWAEHYDGRYGHVVFGHQPYLGNEVKEWKHASGIDLGCVCGGYLCAAVVTEGQAMHDYVMVKSHEQYADPRAFLTPFGKTNAYLTKK